MDFCRGVADLAAAIQEERPCHISARFSLDVNEIVLTIQNALENNCTYQVKSSL